MFLPPPPPRRPGGRRIVGALPSHHIRGTGGVSMCAQAFGVDFPGRRRMPPRALRRPRASRARPFSAHSRALPRPGSPSLPPPRPRLLGAGSAAGFQVSPSFFITSCFFPLSPPSRRPPLAPPPRFLCAASPSPSVCPSGPFPPVRPLCGGRASGFTTGPEGGVSLHTVILMINDN